MAQHSLSLEKMLFVKHLINLQFDSNVSLAQRQGRILFETLSIQLAITSRPLNDFALTGFQQNAVEMLDSQKLYYELLAPGLVLKKVLLFLNLLPGLARV